MSDNIDQGDRQRRIQGFWVYLVQPALVLILFTSFFNFFKIQFDKYYFNKFSAPYQYLNMPINFYILKFIDILLFEIFLIIAFIIILKSLVWIFEKLLKKNIKLDYDHYIIYLLIFFILIGLIAKPSYLYKYKDIISFITPMAVSYWIGRYLYYDINKLIIKFDKSFIFLLIILIVSLNLGLTHEIASYDARNLIEGAPGNYELKLIMNDSRIDLSNKTLILFLVQEGNYYFVERHVPAPTLSSIYAVPVNKVEKAEITRIVDSPNSIVPPDNQSGNMSKKYINKTIKLDSHSYLSNQ